MAEPNQPAETDAEAEDANAAMQAMMGFNSFGGPAKKRKTHDQIDMKDSSSNATSSQAHLNLLPASLPPRPPTTTLPVQTEGRKDFLSQDSVNIVEPAQQPTLSPHISTLSQEGSENLPHRPSQSAVTAPDEFSSSTHKPTAVYSANDIRSDPAYWNTASTPSRTSVQPPLNSRAGTHSLSYGHEIAYTNPDSGISLTQRELDEYSKGKSEVDKDGNTVTVYFRPSFISENLWDRWEGKNASAQERG